MTTKKGDLIQPNLLSIAGVIIILLTMLLDKSEVWLGIGLLLIALGIGVYFYARE